VGSLLMQGSGPTDMQRCLFKVDVDWITTPRPPQGCNFHSLPEALEQNARDWVSDL